MHSCAGGSSCSIVQQVYYWTTIRKNRNAYHSSRGVREEDVTAILQKKVIIEKKPAEAEQELLALSGLKKFSDSLKTQKEKDDFRKHLRRYINIYLPDCPFEVSSTNRYTVATWEASVTARQYIKKGQTVKYLTGIQILMTEEEEEAIKSSRRDFSIVVSSRKKIASLFLGPARFANHDCGANARLTTQGNSGMDIIAVRDIEIGDEITVSYGTFWQRSTSRKMLIAGTGDDYFGDDNSECLCQTCENRLVNGWAIDDPNADGTTPKPSIEEETSGPTAYSLRHPRKRRLSTSSRNQSMTPEVNVRPIVKKTPSSISRFRNGESPVGKSPSVEPSRSPPKRKRDESLSPSPAKSLKKRRMNGLLRKEPSHLSFSIAADSVPSPPSTALSSLRESLSPGAADAQNHTDATSVDDDTIIVEHAPRIVNPIGTKLRKARKSKMSPLDQVKFGEPILVGESTTADHPLIQDDNSSVLSDLQSDMFDDENSTVADTQEESRGRSTTRRSYKKRPAKISKPLIDIDYAPDIRIPGDYALTNRLLTHATDAWICCKICEEFFVQQNSYFTRASCPRCERHSKLYGYRWPKTEKEGRDDSEERVLDHRTIHRFIEPAEERIIRKRNRSVTGAESRAETSEAVQEEEEEEEEEEIEEPPAKKKRGPYKKRVPEDTELVKKRGPYKKRESIEEKEPAKKRGPYKKKDPTKKRGPYKKRNRVTI